ncbi:MAG: DUF3604 domain-containing protein [Pseudomonadota bacterium]
MTPATLPLRLWLSAGATLLLAACVSRVGPVTETATDDLVVYSEQRQPCAQRSPTKRALFGDLHIHTAFSYDARPRGTETTPADAYRFARGEPLGIPPYDENGRPAATQQLDYPLDFAAVTDHSEFFGEMTRCYDAESVVYDLPTCRLIRQNENEGMFAMFRVVGATDPKHLPDVCGEDGEACIEPANDLWRQIQDMAEAAYDRTSACTFTTFVGYEHTGTPNSNNIHRNVLFRNAVVPTRAISYIETPSDRLLWDQLKEQCLEGLDGCDVLAIPHNANLSSGAMFPSYISGFESVESARAMAELRNAMEPVMEVFQHKGNSECFNGLPDILGAPDELCQTEQVLELNREVDVFGEYRIVDFCEDGEVGTRGFLRVGCISKNDFYRSVLLTGLQDEAAIGINSYKLGVIASTDTHMSLAGDTSEEHWKGHLVSEVDLGGRLRNIETSATSLAGNPGGLAGVWSVENSRDAIFDALRRREVFGTTGTRIEPRLFGGWDLSNDACGMNDRAAHGYAVGTPMGSDLAPRPAGAAPKLLASAVAGPDGAPLQKLQLIKGWVDEAGRSNYRIYHLAGAQHPYHNAPDPAESNEQSHGEQALCRVFEDPDFEPDQPAYYYLRAVEIPTLRWSSHACLALAPDQRPRECDNEAPKTIQEMAWTSPIWYLPDSQAATPDAGSPK